jgi:hypothetical protein
MAERLANPDYEPTDEELMELSRAAFADVKARHQVALDALFARITVAREAQRLALGMRET